MTISDSKDLRGRCDSLADLGLPDINVTQAAPISRALRPPASTWSRSREICGSFTSIHPNPGSARVQECGYSEMSNHNKDSLGDQLCDDL